MMRTLCGLFLVLCVFGISFWTTAAITTGNPRLFILAGLALMFALIYADAYDRLGDTANRR